MNNSSRVPFKVFSNIEGGFWRFFCDSKLFACETVHEGCSFLSDILGWYSASRTAFVTDENLRLLPFTKKLSISSNSLMFVLPTPTNVDALQTALIEIRAYQPDILIALGGGTILDAGKLLAASLSTGKDIHQLPGLKAYPSKLLPFIAIPSTFGSGSEANMVSHLETTSGKIGIRQPWLTPTAALLISEIALTSPWKLRYLSAIDSWLHALEALTLNTEYSIVQEALLQQSLLLQHRSFSSYLDNPDIKSASDIVAASTLAGIGLNNSRTSLIHALAGPYAARTGTPHTLSLLPFIEVALQPLLDKVEQRSSNPLLNAKSVKHHYFQNIAPHRHTFMSQLNLSLNDDEIDAMVQECMADQVAIREAPVKITPSYCRVLYQDALNAEQ